jgi:hypothetical protein
MLTGPEAMPVFADGALPPQAKRDIIVNTQTRRANPGGFPRPDRAGHRGPGDPPRRDGLPGAHLDVDYREAA